MTYHSTHFRLFSVTLLWLGALCLLGCEEDIAAPSGHEYPFTLYGVLSQDLDTQFVMVFPVEDRPRLRDPEPLDAVVTSTDLTTGEVHQWYDSLVVNEAGQYEHTFWSPFQGEYEHTYRVEAVRPSDGARSFAEVRIPPRAIIDIDQSDRPTVHVRVFAETIRMLRPEVEYVVQPYDPNFPIPHPDNIPPFIYHTFSYQGTEREIDGGWEFDIRMLSNRQTLQNLYMALALNCQGIREGLALIRLRLNFIIGDEVWDPPGGILDPDQLSEPGLLTNVQNGFGFIGGGYVLEREFVPSPQTIHAACFYRPPPPRPADE